MKIPYFIGIWIFVFCLSGVKANQTNQNFYYELWGHSCQIMQKVWNEWEKEHSFLTQEEYYFAGILSYSCKDTKRAFGYFEKAVKGKKGEWQEMACLWYEYLSKGSVNLEARSNTSCRLDSEMAFLSYTMGNKKAWKQSYHALQKAKEEKQNLGVYWQNLAMTFPEDKGLWKEALCQALTNNDCNKPFFYPHVFYSLYEYVCKEGDTFFNTIVEPQGIEEDKQNSLWPLAYHYGNLGYYYYVQGDENKAASFFLRSLDIYNTLFSPGYRGNLNSFCLVHIMQMSQIWFFCGHYEDMLFYLYRPNHKEAIGIASFTFRPALQFLAAARLKKFPLAQQEILDIQEIWIHWK